MKVKAGGAITRGKAWAADSAKRVTMLTDQSVNESGVGSYTVYYSASSEQHSKQILRDDLLFIQVGSDCKMKPRLFEAIMKDQPTEGSSRACYENLKGKIASHPFLNQYAQLGVKEGLFSDSVARLANYTTP